MTLESLLVFLLIGAFIAGLLFPALGLNLGGGIFGAIANATIGAVLLLVVIRLVKRASSPDPQAMSGRPPEPGPGGAVLNWRMTSPR